MKCGLLGRKLGHSYSPQIHGKLGDYPYALFEKEPEEVADFVKNGDFTGINVTIPYKESIIPYLDDLSDVAREVGAVNCVEVRNGKLIGHNTDVTGIEASLHWLEADEGCKALVLGTGGASKAVQHVLRKRGVEFKVVSRDKSRGDVTYSELTADIIREHKLIINTTPVGMYPNVNEAPAIDFEAIGSDHRIFDLIYNPAQTELLRRAEERGAQTMGGILMLQTQAIASWHIWK